MSFDQKTTSNDLKNIDLSQIPQVPEEIPTQEQQLQILRQNNLAKINKNILQVPQSASFVSDAQTSPISDQHIAGKKKRSSILIQNSRRFSLLDPKKVQFIGMNHISTEASQKQLQISSQNSPIKKFTYDYSIHETNSSNTNNSSDTESNGNTIRSKQKTNNKSTNNTSQPLSKPSKFQVNLSNEVREEKSIDLQQQQNDQQQSQEQKQPENQNETVIKLEEEEEQKDIKKRRKFNLKGIIGLLIDEMNPIIIVMLSAFTFLLELSLSETIQNSYLVNYPDLMCQKNEYQQCEQQVSIVEYIECLDEYYNKLYTFRTFGQYYCNSEGYTEKSQIKSSEQYIHFQDINDDFPLGEALLVTQQLMFIVLIVIAIIIYIKQYGRYGTGSYILFSLRLEYIKWYRYSIIVVTIIFIVTMAAGVIYYQSTTKSASMIVPVLLFTFLLVIQFRYMLLKRRLWLDMENPEFQNAVFNRKGIWEFLLSNNFIYFNALERAAKEDLRNNNHDQLNQMVKKGNVQAIQNLLFNRETWEKNDSYNYFQIFDESKLPEKPEYSQKIHWKSIVFIITNEFRELITIFFQLLLSTIQLTQMAYIMGNDDKLGCHLNSKGSCESQLTIKQYYICINEYLDNYFLQRLFSHRNAYCDQGDLIYDIPEGKSESDFYIINIEYIFLVIKILLWIILLTTAALMIDLVYQYIRQKSGDYNTGQFLTFCLKIDQTIKFKTLSKLLFALYVLANLSILIILVIYQNGSGIQGCIQSTFSVLSEFRVLIFNQKITQNIEDPAFQQAEFHRGGLGWFIWIYSDKYFNYLELAALDDYNHQKQMNQEQEDQASNQIETRPRKISTQISTMSRPIRQISQKQIQSMSDSYQEQLKYYPNLSQYVVKGDIQKIAQILLYKK